MKTKEQVIQEAYGQNWNNVKEHIDENGWLNVDDFYLISQGKLNFTQIETKEQGLIFQNHRPIQLKGLEQNNGWVKIESENDLPKKGDSCHFISKNGYVGIFANIGDYEYIILRNKATHYQIIETPNPPLY